MLTRDMLLLVGRFPSMQVVPLLCTCPTILTATHVSYMARPIVNGNDLIRNTYSYNLQRLTTRVTIQELF